MKQDIFSHRWILCAHGIVGVLVLSARPADAADANLKITYAQKSGLATFVSAANTGAIPVDTDNGAAPTPRDFLRQYGDIFGVVDADSDLRETRQTQDALGAHTEFQQVFGGVDVFSGVLKVHQDANQGFTGANGRFYPIKPGFSTTPSISSSQAAQFARDKSGTPAAVVESSRLTIVDPGWYGDVAIGPHLAYYTVLAAPPDYREAFFVDAHSGQILDRWSLLENARQRVIYDANGTTALPGALVRTEGDGPSGIFEADTAYDYAADVHGFYLRAFGRDGIDDEGGALVATINSTAGLCPNAFWSGTQTVYCAGVVTDDVVAHEFQHGLTQHTANLIFQNQPGQINEAYSDIFGELIDLYNGNTAFPGPAGPPLWPATPTGSGMDQSNNLRSSSCSMAPAYVDGVRWLIAEDATAFPGAIRDMWNPTCFGHPDRANSPLQTCEVSDNGGVHSGSGVANHAFAMMVDGQSFNGYNIEAMGPVKAGAVWYRALTIYLTTASDFEDLAVALNQSVTDLVGTFPNDPATGAPSTIPFTISDMVAVNRAVQATELNSPGRCGASVALLDSSPPRACPRATVLLQDDFENGPGGWTTQTTGPAGPPTPYVWEMRSENLPMGHAGTVWFCADPTLGNCTSQNESAVHSLISPPIILPPSLTFPRLSFSHYMASEPTFDGGNISVRANGGPWKLVPFTAFEYNAYSAYLRPAVLGNTNPRSGQPGWTSAGGDWGTTIVDLSSFVGGGETLEIRFDFSKDGCNGIEGWYVDDVLVYDCPDCDGSGLPDNLDYIRTFASGPRGPVGANSPQSITLSQAAPAAGPVSLRFDASADLGSDSEYIDVFMNGYLLGPIFGQGAVECSLWPNEAVLTVSASLFNFVLSNETVVFDLVPSADVAANSCGNGYISLSVYYAVRIDDNNQDGVIDVCEDCQPNGTLDPQDIANGTSQDCNQNLRPDECDLVSGFSADANANGLPDECDCPVPIAPRLESIASCGGCYYLKNRYLSVISPPVRAPASTVAIRVRLTQLPGPDDCPNVRDFSPYNGVEMWVGQEVLRGGQPTGVYELQSTPYFRDWTTVPGGVVHIADCNIIPCATYTLDAVSDVCDPFFDPYSPPLTVQTVAIWGDVVGAGGASAPNNIVDFSDISAMVDRFSGASSAPHGTRCDLGENRPSGGVLLPINFLDVSYVVDAFRGFSYPFPGPSAPLACPGSP